MGGDAKSRADQSAAEELRPPPLPPDAEAACVKDLPDQASQPAAADVQGAAAAAAAADRAAAAAAAEAERLRLQHAADAFEAAAPERRLFLEVDVAARYAPAALVGRTLRVLWPDDDAWYLGTVESFDPATCLHAVAYADGERDRRLLAAERVRLLVAPREAAAPPSAGELRAAAAALEAAAAAAGGAPGGEAARLRGRAEQLLAAAAAAPAGGGGDDSEDDVPLVQLPKSPPAAEAPPSAQSPPPPSQQQQQRSWLPGDVGWGKFSTFPPWPLLVITPEACLEGINRGAPPGKHRRAPALKQAMLPVVYFGTGEYQFIKAADVTPFSTGLARGFHAPRARRSRFFAAAVCEVAEFLAEGELPRCMAAPNRDGGSDGDDGEMAEPPPPPPPPAAKGARRPAKRAKTAAAAAPAPVDGVPPMPWAVSKALTVLQLGAIEWAHPAFHTEKHFWPVGYRAERVDATPASRGRPARHLCEVGAAADGSGPVFRVTVAGHPPFEAATPAKAWAALYDCGGAAAGAKALGVRGVEKFGLGLPAVLRALRAAPGAAKCERHAGWPDGEAPPPLGDDDRGAVLAAEARLARLPPGVAPQPDAPAGAAGRCHVCWEEEEDDDDLLVQCDACRVWVHQGCYGLDRAPRGELWTCDPCSLGLPPGAPPACVLCPTAGGALKRTTCGRWAHAVCALWVPQTSLDFDARLWRLRGLVRDVAAVEAARTRLPCAVCRQKHGAVVQCCDPACYTAFHLLCARRAGYSVRVVPDESDDESEAEDSVAACAAAVGGAPPEPAGENSQQQQQQVEPKEEPIEEPEPLELEPLQPQQANGAAEAEPSQEQVYEEQPLPSSHRKKKGRSPKRKRRLFDDRGRGKAARRRLAAGAAPEGTKAGGVRLQAFCLKHPPPGGVTQSAAAAAAAAAAGGSQAASGAAAAAAGVGCPVGGAMPDEDGLLPPLESPGSSRAAGCLRAAGAITARRPQPRGHRAPEARAAAEAKQRWVAALPLAPGGTLGRPPGEVPPSWRTLLAPPPPAGAAAALSPTRRPAPAATPLSPLSPAPSAGGAPLTSVAERFAAMRATLHARVVPGRSAIHGWGAFARAPHAEGDFVIEYAGELVRQAVADAREAALYDRLVGAGTYVFALGGRAARCVDATRAGNLAHLLNHSCDPSCVSRTITLARRPRAGAGGGGGGGAAAGAAGGAPAQDGEEGGDEEPPTDDHVVIVARRAIAPGEELTYDYRFSGAERLPCHCGAAACRGLVNEPRRGGPPPLVVPRSKVRPYAAPEGDTPAATPAAAPPAAAGGEAAARA